MERPKKIRQPSFENWRMSWLVGVAGFELATPCTPCKCATRLRYTPKPLIIARAAWLSGSAVQSFRCLVRLGVGTKQRHDGVSPSHRHEQQFAYLVQLAPQLQQRHIFIAHMGQL
jgi:hypothetical protein